MKSCPMVFGVYGEVAINPSSFHPNPPLPDSLAK